MNITVFGATGQTGTGYVVAIGYQTADVMIASELRSLDLTPFRAPDPEDAKVTGDGDGFFRQIPLHVRLVGGQRVAGLRRAASAGHRKPATLDSLLHRCELVRALAEEVPQVGVPQIGSTT